MDTGHIALPFETPFDRDRLNRITQTISAELPGGWSVFDDTDDQECVAEMVLREGIALPPTWVPERRVLELQLPHDTSDDRIAYVSYSALEALRHECDIFTLHGSAADLSGAGVLLIGDKAAGKTSTMLALVNEHAATPIGDDLVCVSHPGSLHLLPGKRTATVRGPRATRSSFYIDAKSYPDLEALGAPAGPVPLRLVIRVSVHSACHSSDTFTASSDQLARLRLHEMATRFVSGLATPLRLSESGVHGPIYRVDTALAAERRGFFIEALLRTRFLNLQAPTPQAAASRIVELLNDVR